MTGRLPTNSSTLVSSRSDRTKYANRKTGKLTIPHAQSMGLTALRTRRRCAAEAERWDTRSKRVMTGLSLIEREHNGALALPRVHLLRGQQGVHFNLYRCRFPPQLDSRRPRAHKPCPSALARLAPLHRHDPGPISGNPPDEGGEDLRPRDRARGLVVLRG